MEVEETTSTCEGETTTDSDVDPLGTPTVIQEALVSISGNSNKLKGVQESDNLHPPQLQFSLYPLHMATLQLMDSMVS